MNQSAEIFVALQRLLPKHGLSRLIARAAESERPWLKDFLINRAIDAFDIDMQEAITDDLDYYPNFNSFFTRELKPGVRPIARAKRSLVSPADGAISQAGAINENRILTPVLFWSVVPWNSIRIFSPTTNGCDGRNSV